MTGFDNIMRSQQFAAQERQFYDAQRYQSDRQAGANIQQGVGMAIDAYQQAQAMEIQKVQVESDLRLQEAVIEDQFHKNKLNTMLMMDQVDMSRIGVKQAQLQYDMGKRQYDEYERDRQDTVSARREKMNAQMLPYLQRQGETIGADGRRRKMTAEEQRAFASGRGGQVNPFSEARLTADYILKKGSVGGLFDPESLTQDERDWLKQAEAGMYGQQIQAQVRSPQSDPGTALEDQYAGAGAASPGAAAPSGAGVRQIPQSIQYHGSMAAGELDPVMMEGLGEETRNKLLVGLGAVAERLGGMGQISPQMAGRYVGSQFMGNDNLDLVAEVLTMADFSDDQIRAYLSTRLTDSEDPDGAVDAIMARRDDYAKRAMRERGEPVRTSDLPAAPQQLPPGFQVPGDLFGGGR